MHNDLPQIPSTLMSCVRKKSCLKRATSAAMVTHEPGLAQPDSVQPGHDHFSYCWSKVGRAMLMFQLENITGRVTLP